MNDECTVSTCFNKSTVRQKPYKGKINYFNNKTASYNYTTVKSRLFIYLIKFGNEQMWSTAKFRHEAYAVTLNCSKNVPFLRKLNIKPFFPFMRKYLKMTT